MGLRTIDRSTFLDTCRVSSLALSLALNLALSLALSFGLSVMFHRKITPRK